MTLTIAPPLSQTLSPADDDPSPELTILMPCLNEARTLATCIAKARRCVASLNITAEILVADNGSTDGSQEIAAAAGARVVPVAARGYGAALIGGMAAARGKYIIMGDADDSYDFENLDPFIAKLRQGNELVMGNRFKGGIRPGAMPLLHRYLGNPVLSGLGRLFFHAPCGDFHCGLRAFDRQAVGRLNLRSTGMELASEMVVKATLHGLRIAEVPTTLSPDGRNRPPHLRSWRDGWRHLRFLLMYSPRWLFVYPGLTAIAAGTGVALWLLWGARHVGGVTLDIHTLMYAAAAVLVGAQAVGFGVFTKVFAVSEGLWPEDWVERMLRKVSLEAGVLAGVLLVLAGLGLSGAAVWHWKRRAFGDLDPRAVSRMVVPALTCLTLGVQVVLGAFFLSVLRLRRR